MCIGRNERPVTQKELDKFTDKKFYKFAFIGNGIPRSIMGYGDYSFEWQTAEQEKHNDDVNNGRFMAFKTIKDVIKENENWCYHVIIGVELDDIELIAESYDTGSTIIYAKKMKVVDVRAKTGRKQKGVQS
ncbi:MAG: hypothetical protein KAS32_14500 [Candidatus Peribacteraceae bacterium]|nr:hypothetical protein [Candidatus Peribacteraceae bacterium]